MSEMDRWAWRVNGRTQPETPVTPCRVRQCAGKGHGGYCQKHTPKGGVGVLCCVICGKPTIDHEIGEHLS